MRSAHTGAGTEAAGEAANTVPGRIGTCRWVSSVGPSGTACVSDRKPRTLQDGYATRDMAVVTNYKGIFTLCFKLGQPWRMFEHSLLCSYQRVPIEVTTLVPVVPRSPRRAPWAGQCRSD